MTFVFMDNVNYFDQRAQGWDNNSMHHERSQAIVGEILRRIPLSKNWKALEFGAGTGISSFLLKDHLKEITLMDNSPEMIRITDEKIAASGAVTLNTLLYDLENSDYKGSKYDFIFSQMALHHITDIDAILKKLWNMLNKGGYIAIADLYEEDGSFHGEGFKVHRGFNPSALASLLEKEGFKNTSSSKCYTIKKEIQGGVMKDFDIFLLTASK
jgi:ubiquinone/menaquinone biosynthesis C-methylase UbiE